MLRRIGTFLALFSAVGDGGGAPPPPPAGVTHDDFKKFAETIGSKLENIKVTAQLPPPPPPEPEWNKQDYWLVDGNLPPEQQNRALHEKITKYVDHKVTEKVKPWEEKYGHLEAGVNYLGFAKGDDPEFKSSETRLREIMNEEGCSAKTAMRLLKAEKGAAAPPPTAQPKPTPGKHATAPTTSTEPSAPKTRAMPNARRIIKEGLAKGEIKF